MNGFQLPTRWVELPPEKSCAPDSRGQYRIPLVVSEPAGLALTAQPVTSGVPLPESALWDTQAVRVLTESGAELPLQTQALAHWPDGSIKWLLLDFQLDLAPNESARLTLELGNGVVKTARHPTPLTVESIAEGVAVSTAGWPVAITTAQLPFGLQSIFTARSVDGSRDGFYTSTVDDIRVEERGPLRAVVRVAGWHTRADGRRSMPFILRFTLWAGRPVLGVQHTFIISDDPLTTFWRGIGVQLPVERGVTVPAVLVRDRAKLLPKEEHFEATTNTLRIYLWPLHGPELDLRSVLITQPSEFQHWKQQYPELFARLEGGPMTPAEAQDFYTGKKPCRAMGDWRARTGKGVARTHELFITTGSEQTLRPFDKPLLATCPPAWNAHTAALGQFHPRDEANFPAIERAIDMHLAWLYRHQHEWQLWDNFWDRGDYLGVYDTRRGAWWRYDDGMRGWNNGEVNTDHGPFLQFLRTGDRRHFDFAEAIARHRMDCDQCHYEDDHPAFVGGLHRHHLTEHWTGLIDGGHQWNDGMLDLYYLTGLRRALECAVEVAEYAMRYAPVYAVRHGDTSRETNNALRILARTFEATSDERYRAAADAIARAYLCSFAEDGTVLSLTESLAQLQREFAGSPWENLPEIAAYDWHGHAGYQYIGYLAPAAQYAATLCRTPATRELARRLDHFARAVAGHAGQYYGERYLETGDSRYLLPVLRHLPQALDLPVPLDGRGDQPGSYGDARLDYLYGVPYLLAALYRAREELPQWAVKETATVTGYRAGSPARRGRATPVDLSAVANRDPRRNPFGRVLVDDDAQRLPALQPPAIGFQPYAGNRTLQAGYRPVAAYQLYPSTTGAVTPNQHALAGVPYGGTVTWAGVTFRFLNPDANESRAVIVLGANEAVTIPIQQTGAWLHLVGHVHGKKESRRLSQFAPVQVGEYALRYADGHTETIALRNGVHFDNVFAPACAGGVEHLASFDWPHVYANMTDDQVHLNKLTVPLRAGVRLESLTFRSAAEDWGLVLAAVTVEGEEPAHDQKFAELPAITWSDLPGWLHVKQRREADGDALKLFAPARLSAPLPDGEYEVALTVSGDPVGWPRLRVENCGRQVLADACLPGDEQAETIYFRAEARAGELTLELTPGQNYATGSLFPERGFTGQFGARLSPQGNFTRIEALRFRRCDGVQAVPVDPGLRYGWLLPGAAGDTVHGLVVDREDADGNSATTMKWKAGGFRVDVPNGRYKVRLHHSTYAPLNTVCLDLDANRQPVCRDREVAEEVLEFETDATAGCIQLDWRQPRVHSRVPRYAIRAIILEPVGPR